MAAEFVKPFRKSQGAKNDRNDLATADIYLQSLERLGIALDIDRVDNAQFVARHRESTGQGTLSLARPGQEETPIIGNVSLEYLLTENGRYRLRGFRKSEYENIIDGQMIITWVALIFNREFNEFSELFNPLKEAGVNEDKEKTEE